MHQTHHDSTCKGPAAPLWKLLSEQFADLAKTHKANAFLHNECKAASELAERTLHGREQEAESFASIRIIYWKVSATGLISTHQGVKKAQADQDPLRAIEMTLERICQVSTACCGDEHNGISALLQVLELSGRLKRHADAIGKLFADVNPNLPLAGAKLKDSFATPLSRAVDDFVTATQDAFNAQTACDAFVTRDTREILMASATEIAFRFDNLNCEMARIKCLTQPAFFELLQVESERFAFTSAMCLGAIDQVIHTPTGLGMELKSTWQKMRKLVTGDLKQQFNLWQERQLCPPSACYDNATEPLLQSITAGLSDTSNFGHEPHCFDEARIQRHRMLVVAATKEVEKLHCKEWPDHAVLTRIGALTMDLHSTLGGSARGLAVAVRAIVEGWTETRSWLTSPPTDPTPRVARHLRTLVGAYHWFENRLDDLSTFPPARHQQAATAQAGRAQGISPGEGQMIFDVVDPQGNPCTYSRVTITNLTTNQRSEGLTDQDGRFQGVFPIGRYEVITTRGEQGMQPAAFPIQVN